MGVHVPMFIQEISVRTIWYRNHLYRCLIFLLCLNWLMSIYSAFFPDSDARLYLTSFLSSFIFSSFSLYSFYFSFRISNFFYSSILFCSNSKSIALIFYCQSFSPSLLSCSRMLISSSRLLIISGVIDWIGFLDFNLSLAADTLCYSSLSLSCLDMYCSWFLLRIFSASATFSFIVFAYYLTLLSYFLRSSTLSWYSCSVVRFFMFFFWSFLILSKPYFS